MSERYVGEIRMFAGSYAPIGWALCEGQLISIAENEALFTLLGTIYGGDGVTTFGLPDLRGRIPVHPSSTIPPGSKAGEESVTLNSSQLPVHTHLAKASLNEGDVISPSNAVWAAANLRSYSTGDNTTPVLMNGQVLSGAGGNQPHDNMMPSLTISFIIALDGVYPSRE